MSTLEMKNNSDSVIYFYIKNKELEILEIKPMSERIPAGKTF